MKLLAILALLVALAASAPTSKESSSEEEEKLVIDEKFFPDELKIYTAEHEIIELILPLNSLNFDENDDDNDEDETEKTIFFVEADTTNGIEYKGLSVYKNGTVTKILATGTSVTAANDESNTAYFGATDGIYQYKKEDNTAIKFGSITDSIISIAKVNGSDILYIVTDKNEVFKVTDDGTKKEQVADATGAKQIVLDNSNNLYFYGNDNKAKVITDEGVKEIEGLPSDVAYIKLLSPAFIMEDCVPIVLDERSYKIFANGSSEITEFEFKIKPTAYAMQGTILQYYAHNKSIYEYNLLSLILGDEVSEIKSFLSEKEDELQSIATRKVSSLL